MRQERSRTCVRCVLVVSVCVAMLSFGSFAFAQKTADGLVVERSSRTGLATFVTSAYGGPITLKKSAMQAAVAPTADDFLAEHGHLFGVTDRGRQLVQIDVAQDREGTLHTDYQQVHDAVPVFGGRLKVHQDGAGNFTAANGHFFPISDKLSTTPTINEADAVKIAMDALNDGSPKVEKVELLIVDPSWYGARSTGSRLAWHIILNGSPAPVRESFFIDASNGRVLDRWSMILNARNRKIYDAEHSTNIPGTLVRSEGDPPVAGSHPDVDIAYDYYADVYGYFQRAFGRDSIDNAGMALIASVDLYASGVCPNAFWTGEQMIFCAGLVVDDVVAHELSHGVTEYSANLVYQNQPGQLNESFSDVFGELVDLFNGNAAFPGVPGGSPTWPVEPDRVSGSGTDAPNGLRTVCSDYPGYPDGVRWICGEDASSAFGQVLRDMWDPHCAGDPDRANDNEIDSWCYDWDEGGVHFGSGIPNHAFALLVDGGTFNGKTITGIGPIKAGAIWYRALTVYLTPTSDFKDSYSAFKQAAADLVGQSINDPRTGQPWSEQITDEDVQQVDNALVAVEMNTDGRCGAVADPIPPLDPSPPPVCENEVDVLLNDFESGAAGWSVSHTTGMDTPYDWVLTDQGLPSGGHGKAWFCKDPNNSCSGASDESGVHYLDSPSIALPVDITKPTLSFRHYNSSENYWDGGNLQIKVSSGAWTAIPKSAFKFNAYNMILRSNTTNPLEGQDAFGGSDGVWATSVVNLEGLVSAGQSFRIRFQYGKDYCGGTQGWYIDDFRIYNCGSIPRVSRVDSANPDGYYSVEQELTIQVRFDSAVVVTGSPRLLLETGATDRYAAYQSGSGSSNVLNFHYVVQDGDYSLDLDYVSESALELNGGTIKDPKGRDAVIALAAPGATGSLGASRNLRVIGIPTLATPVFVPEPPATGGHSNMIEWNAINQAEYYQVQCALDAAFSNVAQSVVALENSFQFNGLTLDVTYWYRVRAKNNQGGYSKWSSSVFSQQLEHVPPMVLDVTSNKGNGSYGVGEKIDVQVIFDSPVKVTGVPHLLLETGIVDREAVYQSGSGTETLEFLYTVEADDASADLDCANATALSLNGGTIQDAAGRDAVLTLPGAPHSLAAHKNLIIDTRPKLLAPVVAGIASKVTGVANTIAWNAVSGAVLYRVQRAADPDFVSIIEETDWIADTQRTFTSLVEGQTYWYRVIARDADGFLSEWSNVVSSQQIPENKPPVAKDQSVTAYRNASLSIQLEATDADQAPGPLAYVIVVQPSQGQLSDLNAAAGKVTYTPAADYVGADTFTFKANDGLADSNVATVSIDVQNASAPPPPPSGGGGGGVSGGGTPPPAVTQYTLTARVIDGHGSIAPQSGTYAVNAVVPLTASPEAGYRVKMWTGTNDDASTSASNAVTMTGDRTVTVQFEHAPLEVAVQAESTTLIQGQSTKLTSTVTGGVAPYTYLWTPTNSLSSTSLAETSVSPIRTTIYQLTVADSKGQAAQASILVTVNEIKPEPPVTPPTIEPTEDPDDNEQPVPVTAPCGAGVAESALMAMLMLSMAQFRRRMR